MRCANCKKIIHLKKPRLNNSVFDTELTFTLFPFDSQKTKINFKTCASCKRNIIKWLSVSPKIITIKNLVENATSGSV